MIRSQLAAFLAASTLIATSVFAEPVRLAMDDAPQAISQLLKAEQPSAARELAQAALNIRPTDPLLLLLLARSEIALGRYDRAIALAKQVYDSATADNTKYFAARIRAEAHSAREEFTRAQYWLRIASQRTTRHADLVSLGREYRLVQSANPWSSSLRFGASPNNNVNNGSSANSYAPNEFTQGINILLDRDLDHPLSIDAENRALSGISYSIGGQLQYRLRSTNTSATFVTGSVDYRTHVLTAEASNVVPDAVGSDFASGVLTAGVSHRQVYDESSPITLRANIGQYWFDSKAYSQFAEVGFSQTYTIDTRNSVSVSGSLINQTLVDSGDRSRLRSAQLAWRHQFENADQLTLTLRAKDNRAENPNSRYSEGKISADYSFAKPFAGLKLAIGFDYSQTHHPNSIYAQEFGARDATTYGLRGTARFNEIEYFGFSPAVTIAASRSDSTVDLFDRENLSLGFDLVSSF